MAVIKPSPRRRFHRASSISEPNNIPLKGGRFSQRVQRPVFRSKFPISSHRKPLRFPFQPVSNDSNVAAKARTPGCGLSARAFKPVNRPARPLTHPRRQASAPLKRSKRNQRQQANTAKQTLEKKGEDSEGKSSSIITTQVELISFPDSFDAALERYHQAYEARLHELRKWVNLKHAEHRIDFGVTKELNAYFGKRKFGDRPSAKHLSKYACQALELSEHDLGTDLAWAKSKTWMLGERWGPVFREMIVRKMAREDYGVCGPGYVGEEDLESWAGDTEYWKGERREEMDWEDELGGGIEGEESGLGELEVEKAEGTSDEGHGWDWLRMDTPDADEVTGLGFLDDLGNVPQQKEGEEMELEIDIEY